MQDNFVEFENKDRDCRLELRSFRGELQVEVEDDWWGDSFRGFGARTGITLTKAQARRLRDFLNEVFE